MKLHKLLSQPEHSQHLSLSDWASLLSEARYMGMLAQLKTVLNKSATWQLLPLKVRETIESDFCIYRNQHRLLTQESQRLSAQLAELDVQHAYLKGSAYQLLELGGFEGRLMSDIDILVSREQLPVVEKALLKQGWIFTKSNDYDDRFYREWSHEIPPLRHIERGVELDVHFNILPIILKRSPSPKLLLSKLSPLNRQPSAHTLTPAALLFHSIVHLFYESEYDKGLRDLHDIKMLMEHFGSSEFWRDLIELEQEVGNGDSIYWALRFSRELFGYSPPTEVLAHFKKKAPNKLIELALGWSFKQVFCNNYPPNRLKMHFLAEKLLYWRGHLKRMPLYRLIPHLVNKSWRRVVENEKETLEDVFKEG